MSLVTTSAVANSALTTFAFATNTAFAGYRINAFSLSSDTAAAMNVKFVGVTLDTGATGTVAFGVEAATALGMYKDLLPSSVITMKSSSPTTVTIAGGAAFTGTLTLFYDHY